MESSRMELDQTIMESSASEEMSGLSTLGRIMAVPSHGLVFEKVECSSFVASSQNQKICGCGRPIGTHRTTPFSILKSKTPSGMPVERWSISSHTMRFPTDAVGVVEFQGGPHPHRANYVRMNFDSKPDDIMEMFLKNWGLEPPKLVITVHGGITNFDLTAKLSLAFRSGLLKAAKTTGAWIITSGINAGVVRHVAAALDAGSMYRKRSRIVTIGIAPWGLLKQREALIGDNTTVPYHPYAFSPKGRYAVLNDRHSYFLLVDNGTVGRYGADVVLRKRFEEYLTRTELKKNWLAPLVAVVLEGGSCTIRSVLDHVTSEPAVPVVVIDGSGRASDLLSFAHARSSDSGTFLEDNVKGVLVRRTMDAFGISHDDARKVAHEVMLCTRRKQLLTIFRLGEDKQQDIDHAILTALLKGQQMSAPNQLSLALAWNRVDIAKSDIFVLGQEWPADSLEWAMLEALKTDRVDFVKLLLENGVQMDKFLTFARLEELYKPENNPPALLFCIANEMKRKRFDVHNLRTVGLVIEKLIGNAYRSNYTTKSFIKTYDDSKSDSEKEAIAASVGRDMEKESIGATTTSSAKGATSTGNTAARGVDFEFPFNELFLWAVLTKRQAMARCMWEHGEEAICKALIAEKLYTAMSEEAADFVGMGNDLKQCAEEFHRLALDILGHCYQENAEQTLRVLTCERQRWNKHTCLSLAFIADNKQFVAHPCCQIILADLWLGGLKIRKSATFSVISAIIVPPLVLNLGFKTRDELMAQPQSLEQHQNMEKRALAKRNVDQKQNEVDAHLKSNVFDRRSRMASVGVTPVPTDGRSVMMPHSAIYSTQQELVLTTADEKDAKQKPVNSLSWRNKIHEFYAAPISTFWAFTMAYLVFMAVFHYVCLIKMTVRPRYTEWYLFAYCLVTFCELLRKLFLSHPESFVDKLKQFVSRKWNIYNVLISSMFFVGFILRHVPYSVDFLGANLRSWGKVILVCNCSLWLFKLYELISVHPRMGIYITMMGKMVMKMSAIGAILMIQMTSFGFVRQAITYPHEPFGWLLVRNIFFKPYFMLYGEVYAGEIDTCNDKQINCVAGYWVPPVYMVVFLLMSNVLLINLLIAIFNDVYQETMAISEQIWLFQRYEQVMEFEAKPFLPPPLTVISHLWLLLKYLWFNCRRCYRLTKKGDDSKVPVKEYFGSDVTLKLFLLPEQIAILNDFEEDCMEDLQRTKDFEHSCSTNERIYRSTEKTEFISMKLNDLMAGHEQMKANIHNIMQVVAPKKEPPAAPVEEKEAEIVKKKPKEKIGQSEKETTKKHLVSLTGSQNTPQPAAHDIDTTLSTDEERNARRGVQLQQEPSMALFIPGEK